MYVSTVDPAARRAFLAQIAGATQEIAAADILEVTDLSGTQEVTLEDILEAVAVPRDDDVAGPATHADPWEPVAQHADAAAALDERVVTTDRAAAQPALGPRHRRHRSITLVAALAVVPLGILSAAGAMSIASRPPASVVSLPPTATATPARAPTPARTAPAPAEAKPTAGTIVAPPKKKLILDGKRIDATSAIVTCGMHVVKLGSGKAHEVDVPCGGEIALK